jgi:NAD(P) transhydrogenase subunit beta
MLVLPVGGADVPIVISLLNAFTGLTVAAGGYVLGNTLLLSRHAGRRGRYVADQADGRRDGPSSQHPLRRRPRRLDPRRRHGVRPAGALGRPEDVAILLGVRERVIIVPATASPSPRRSTPCASSSRCCRAAA